MSTRPTSWHTPSSETGVVDLVRAIGTAGERLHVVGAGHSWSGIAAPDGHAVTLDHLTGVVSVDRERGVATVRAGTRLRDLSAALAAHGLTLPVLGSIQQQSVAGAIATGTHGSSLAHGNLASLVRGLRLVDGNGDVVDLTGERLTVGRVHLGVLGVVTQLTLTVVPSFRLRQRVEHVPVESVAGRLAEVAHSAEYVKAWWLPGARRAQLVRYERTTDVGGRGPAYRRCFDERVLHRWLFPAMIRYQHSRPQSVPRINDRLSGAYLGPLEQVGPMALMLNTPVPVRHRETEAALPLSRAGEALGRLVEVLQRDPCGANFPLEVRFVPADEAWLSPAQGEDACQIGAYSTDGPRCDDLFSAFWDVMRPRGARPHWGKELDHEAAELKGLYPRWDAFQALRDELDPTGVLGNAFTASALG